MEKMTTIYILKVTTYAQPINIGVFYSFDEAEEHYKKYHNGCKYEIEKNYLFSYE